jgi:hypothetical protein
MPGITVMPSVEMTVAPAGTASVSTVPTAFDHAVLDGVSKRPVD